MLCWYCCVLLLVIKIMLNLLQSTELQIYTDFLRLVLEIINAILTYTLPRNPEVLLHSIRLYMELELLLLPLGDLITDSSFLALKQVVYAIMHRQEVFQPFRSHPRFNELLENIYTVCMFFLSSNLGICCFMISNKFNSLYLFNLC